MSNLFNADFREFILALNKHEVEYLLIGGYTVILYGYPRTTGDLDIWLKNTDENRLRLVKACHECGLPTNDLTKDKFENPAIEVFTFGKPPVCIELIIRISGIEFEEIDKNHLILEPDGFPVRVVSYQDLVIMKKRASRPKDLDDLNNIKDAE